MMRSPVLILAALPFFSGCGTTVDTPAKTAVVPAPKQAQTPTYSPETPKLVKPSAAPETAKPTYPDIEILRGKTSDGVTTILGAPDFRRTDNPAELWQYRHDKCSVDLFLYSHNGGGLSVDFLDIRTHGDQDISLQACFVAILKARGYSGGRG